MESLIAQYGYIAVVLGTFLEGETILFLAAFAAHREYLSIDWVIVSAFAGTVAGDQLYFYLGRTRGKALLEKRPGWRSKAERVFNLLHARPTMFILGFRFFYGIRTIAPFIIGMSRLSVIKFVLLNFTGATIWALVIGVLGYSFGAVVETYIDDVKHYELLILVLIAGSGALAWGIYFIRQQSRRTGRRTDAC